MRASWSSVKMKITLGIVGSLWASMGPAKAIMPIEKYMVPLSDVVNLPDVFFLRRLNLQNEEIGFPVR